MRCKLCRKPAVYAPLRFCKDHFLAYYEKKVRKYLDSTHTKNRKILIGVSGGKDSSALIDILAHVKEEYDLDLALFIIDLAIPGYSDEGLTVCKELSERYGIPLVVEDLKEREKRIPDFAGPGRKPCGPCGTIKRYLLNKVAWDRGYDFVATGHNLDDEFFFAMHSLLHRDVEQLRRSGKTLPKREELQLAGRIKPLYYLTEKENRLYCLLKDIPHYAEECPYSTDNPQIRFKEQFAHLPKDEKKNLLKSIQKLQEQKEATATGSAPGEIHPCPSCAFPTTSKDGCVFCKLMSGERKK